METPRPTLSPSMGSSKPPPAASFDSIVHAYTGLVLDAARRAGIPKRDAPDIAQHVFWKLHEAMGRGLDTSVSPVGWLRRTTYTIARDHLKLARNARELVTEDVDLPDSAPDPEQLLAAKDAYEVLDELSPEHRMVLAMSMDGMPMSEIADILGIPVPTGYSRLAAARRAFERALAKREGSGEAAVMPLAVWEVGPVVALGWEPPSAPPGFAEEILRRLAAVLGTGATGGARADVVRARGLVLTRAQVAAGVLVCVLAGAGLHALLAQPAPSAVTAVRERVTAAEPTPAPSMLVAPTSLARPETQEPSAPVVSNGKREDEAELIRRARFALRRRDATTALALLAKVKSPRFTAQRDAAREDALVLQGDAGEP
jgi:RNA polymerase sigma-70 factor, ECF subfamily